RSAGCGGNRGCAATVSAHGVGAAETYVGGRALIERVSVFHSGAQDTVAIGVEPAGCKGKSWRIAQLLVRVAHGDQEDIISRETGIGKIDIHGCGGRLEGIGL